MNRIFISLMITLLLVGFSGCGQKKSTMHPLVVATPERPSGQEDVIQLTAPKMLSVLHIFRVSKSRLCVIYVRNVWKKPRTFSRKPVCRRL